MPQLWPRGVQAEGEALAGREEGGVQQGPELRAPERRLQHEGVFEGHPGREGLVGVAKEIKVGDAASYVWTPTGRLIVGTVRAITPAAKPQGPEDDLCSVDFNRSADRKPPDFRGSKTCRRAELTRRE